MSVHPSSQSIAARTIFIAAAVAAGGLLWLLVAVYGGLSVWSALSGSAIYMAALSAVGYAYWYVAAFLHGFAAKALATLTALIVAAAVTFATTSITGVCAPGEFARLLPLLLVYGLAAWLILSLCYQRFRDEQEQEQEPSEPVTPVSTPPPTDQVLDRISVKNGPEIEIIQVGTLYYIQAYGDYVMLHTEKERHIKEQTMKFYESSLPDCFVRVHRSFIVNTNCIARVELAGKESYTIKLKNGVAIRASITGYKLLRQKLSL